MDFAYAYLHGFRSDVHSIKAKVFKQRFEERGISLEVLDVKGGKGHEDALVSIGLDVLDQFYEKTKKPLRLIGSSMGGFISAVFAARHPDRVDRVILINPAVHLKETWKTITDPDDPTKIAKWKTNGSMTFLAGYNNEPCSIPYAYVEDSLQFEDYPDIRCPSLVFVGSQDQLVPPKTGYVFQLEQTNPELMQVIELDDDHSFHKAETLENVFTEAMKFFV